MITKYISGFLSIFSGVRLLMSKGIRRYALVPLLVNIVVFALAIKLAVAQFSLLMASMFAKIAWLPEVVVTGLEWILWPLFAIGILVAIYYSFTMLANLIAAPFNSLLAKKVEQHLRGEVVFEENESVMQVAGRSIGSEIKKILHMLKWLIVLLLITIIPGLNMIAPFAWVFYGVWMLAIEYADYPMGNHEMYFKEELQTLKKNRMSALGFGSGVMLLSAIPVVNFIAMPASVAAGTALWVKRLSDNR